MRTLLAGLTLILLSSQVAFAQDLTEEQMGPWKALEAQVALDMKTDFEGMREYLHPQGCYWGDNLATPVGLKTYDYYSRLRRGQDRVVAHALTPVSVVVVDDVAIINFYAQFVTKNKDGEETEKVVRGHNTWKKKDGKWLLLSTYNTAVKGLEE